jgi:hypothetical protein
MFELLLAIGSFTYAVREATRKSFSAVDIYFLQRAFALHAHKRYKLSCKSVLLLHPIETFVIFLFKFVLLGQKYIWPKPDRQDLHWTNGKRPFAQGLRTDSRASSGRIWHLASRHSINIWPVSGKAQSH